MHAAIFDIDGTLLDSCDADGALYVEAIRSVLGDVRIRDSWGLYEHVTDSGILAEIGCDNGFQVDTTLERAVADEFVMRLSHHLQRNGPFQERPGARDYVLKLIKHPSACIAYATGSWRTSATLKLASAGFPLSGIPLASSDDYADRTHIMLHAFAQILQPVRSVTYFGDGIWDQAAALRLGWNFVPVGTQLGGIVCFEPMPRNPAFETNAVQH